MPRAKEPGLDSSRPGWVWSVPGELPAVGSAMIQLTVGLLGMMAQLADCELASVSTGLLLVPLATAPDGFYALSGHDVAVFVERENDVTWVSWFFEHTRQDWCFRRSSGLVVGGKCGAEPNLRARLPLHGARPLFPTRGAILFRL